MLSLLKIRTVCLCLLLMFFKSLSAQLISDTHISKNYDCSSCGFKSTAVNSFKTLRVNVHFILGNYGTGNFSETCNINGTISNENGYWLANTIINSANNYLSNNIEMTQKLSNTTYPVSDINFNYRLNGVFFHRNASFYESFYAPPPLIRNDGAAINVFLFSGRDGQGAAGSDDCWLGGMMQAYLDYTGSSNLWYIHKDARPLNHEICHILSLDHPKRGPDGTKSTLGGTQYFDNCDDTPTFLELINDGYADPYEWCNGEYSNNLMDYSCDQRALTVCQIDQIHSYIETNFSSYLYGNFQNSYAQITNFTENMSYIAETVEVPSFAFVSIANNKKLYLDAREFIINGTFEVPLGSDFEFIPYGM